MRNETYKVQMCCFNCGLLADYDIPQRREIVSFERWYGDRSSKEPEMILSCTQRRNGSDRQPLMCGRCKLPYLQPAFYVQAVPSVMPVGPGGIQ